MRDASPKALADEECFPKEIFVSVTSLLSNSQTSSAFIVFVLKTSLRFEVKKKREMHWRNAFA
jgi:hypothetical protein